MTRKRISIAFVVVLLIASIVMSLSIYFISATPRMNDEALLDAEGSIDNNVATGAGIDAGNYVIKMVRKVSGSLAKKYIPGGFADSIVESIFDLIGLKPVTKAKEVYDYAKKLDTIEKKLDETSQQLNRVLSKMDQIESQRIIGNVKGSFSKFDARINAAYKRLNKDWIIPIMENYAVLSDDYATDEARSTASANIAALEAKEADLYRAINPSLTNFGVGGTMGDIDFILQSLMDDILAVGYEGKDIMKHFHVASQHLWSYDMEEIEPKLNFMDYLSTIISKGVVLFLFKNDYEIREALDAGDSVTAESLMEKWSPLGTEVDIDKPINRMDLADDDKSVSAYWTRVNGIFFDEVMWLEELDRINSVDNTTYHYATKSRVSKNIYAGQILNWNEKNVLVPNDGSATNRFIYSEYVQKVNPRGKWKNFNKYIQSTKATVLDASEFGEIVAKEYKEYKTAMKGDAGLFTIRDYFAEIGFAVDTATDIPLYLGQEIEVKGKDCTMRIKVLDMNGEVKTYDWGKATFTGTKRGADTWKREVFDACDMKMLAFKNESNKLIGTYKEVLNRSDITAEKNQLYTLAANIGTILPQQPYPTKDEMFGLVG